MKILGIGNELTLLAEGFVGSFEVCTVDTDNTMYWDGSVNELVKEPTRLGESLSFLSDLDNEPVDIDSM